MVKYVTRELPKSWMRLVEMLLSGRVWDVNDASGSSAAEYAPDHLEQVELMCTAFLSREHAANREMVRRFLDIVKVMRGGSLDPVDDNLSELSASWQHAIVSDSSEVCLSKLAAVHNAINADGVGELPWTFLREQMLQQNESVAISSLWNIRTKALLKAFDAKHNEIARGLSGSLSRAGTSNLSSSLSAAASQSAQSSAAAVAGSGFVLANSEAVIEASPPRFPSAPIISASSVALHDENEEERVVNARSPSLGRGGSKTGRRSA